MKCLSCEENIPPKFAHAIKSNICPFCGGQIMPPLLQEALTSLHTIMKDAEPYMEQIEEWLGANYGLYKKGSKSSTVVESGDPFSPVGEDDVDALLNRQKAAAKMTAEFQKRAEIGKISSKGLDKKSIIEKVNGGGGYAAAPSEFVGIDPDYGPIDMSQETEDPLTTREAAQMIHDIAEDDNDPVKAYYEKENLKRIHNRGSGAFIRGR